MTDPALSGSRPGFDAFARRVLDPAGIEYRLEVEPDNAEYGAAILTTGILTGAIPTPGALNVPSTRWRIRQARVTPTKTGAFVSVWRRAADGGTEPFQTADAGEGLLVFVTDATGTASSSRTSATSNSATSNSHDSSSADSGSPANGVFVFTPEHLVSLGVLGTDEAPGKRGFRVYPPWCVNLNPQAARTQRAQSPAFVTLGEGEGAATSEELLRRLSPSWS